MNSDSFFVRVVMKTLIGMSEASSLISCSSILWKLFPSSSIKSGLNLLLSMTIIRFCAIEDMPLS